MKSLSVGCHILHIHRYMKSKNMIKNNNKHDGEDLWRGERLALFDILISNCYNAVIKMIQGDILIWLIWSSWWKYIDSQTVLIINTKSSLLCSLSKENRNNKLIYSFSFLPLIPIHFIKKKNYFRSTEHKP